MREGVGDDGEVMSMEPASWSMVDMKAAIASAAAPLKHDLNKEQVQSISKLASGKDVFVSLPTG